MSLLARHRTPEPFSVGGWVISKPAGSFASQSLLLHWLGFLSAHRFPALQ